MGAMSNVESGLFRPIRISDGYLLSFRYTASGFVPVITPNRPAGRGCARDSLPGAGGGGKAPPS
jgi:hypothetical protein